jgi:biopolymer transport protein ExbD
MRFPSPKTNVAEVDMTPMIDIVFLLIAFFMVITNFEQTLADERVKLPKDELARPQESRRDKDLVLNVGFIRDTDGRKLSEPLVFYAGDQVPVLQMGPLLQRERRLYRDTGIAAGEVTVVIRADAEVPTGLVQELIKLSQEAEFEKFALKAMQSSERD